MIKKFTRKLFMSVLCLSAAASVSAQTAEVVIGTRIGETAKMVAMLPSEYYLVGEGVLNPALMTAHDIYKNLDIYRYECVAGGGINGLKSTAVLKAN
jgi:hypothetical protein